MSFEKAKEHLSNYNLQNMIMQFDVSSATVSQASLAVGCTDAEIAKSLAFIVDNKPIIIVTSGDCKIDNSKFKSVFLTKAKMIPFEDVEQIVGHAVGGVCPFGVNCGVDVYLDISLKRFDVVYPACGSSNSAVKLNLQQLELASDFTSWVDVCKLIEK